MPCLHRPLSFNGSSENANIDSCLWEKLDASRSSSQPSCFLVGSKGSADDVVGPCSVDADITKMSQIRLFPPHQPHAQSTSLPVPTRINTTHHIHSDLTLQNCSHCWIWLWELLAQDCLKIIRYAVLTRSPILFLTTHLHPSYFGRWQVDHTLEHWETVDRP